MDSLDARIASAPAVTVTGRWYRHASALWPERALIGHTGYGRWGTKTSCPVLYLGRPIDSVTIEAYRHLVDPVEDPAVLAELRPRLLVTTDVHVTGILDLRSTAARRTAGLTLDDLRSSITDRTAYARCQDVAAAAHDAGRHGVVTPAATRHGDTLVLFADVAAAAGELPVRTAPDVAWNRLPPDPRTSAQRPPRLRVVRDRAP